MTTENNYVAFGLTFADMSISWPARGRAEKDLKDRDGWEKRTIPTICKGKPSTVEAMCCGDLAVNHMLGEEEGFAISLANSGFRISFGGRVFAKSTDCMMAAESMLEACQDWPRCEVYGYTEKQRNVLRTVMEAAERRGEILLDRVYPE